jgi:hypothetical protein
MFNLTAHLQNFTDHFIERLIAMSAADVDSDVSLQTIRCLRDMQKLGLLDSVSEESLDIVDRVVFDSEASREMRTEAILFLMDHTQGFDDDEEEEEEERERDGGRDKGREKGREKNVVAMERMNKAYHRNIALQLETLTEFAEHHLSIPIEQERGQEDETKGEKENEMVCHSENATLLAEALLETHKACKLLITSSFYVY